MRSRRTRMPALVLALWLLPVPARGAVAVFSNDGGVNNHEEEVLTEASGQILDLYLELGTVDSGDACRDTAAGDEVCGYHVKIRVDGAGFIESFVGASGSELIWPDTFTGTVRNLDVAFVIDGGSHDPLAATPDPLHIGTLTVNATGGARVLVTGDSAIDAGLMKRGIPSDTIAATPLPEPQGLAQALAGLLTLALLERLRRRRQT